MGKSPGLKDSFEQLLQCTRHANHVQHLEQALLAKLQQMHTTVQDAQLRQTQGQVAGLYQLLQMQSSQLQFARQAKASQVLGAQVEQPFSDTECPSGSDDEWV